MKTVQITFSPTGGTQKVADCIVERWELPPIQIDLTHAGLDASTFPLEQDDRVLLAVPSYGGRVPALAAERLAQLQGNQAQCAIVCVYGNRAYEDTLVELKDIAEQCGFRVVAAISAVAEHSIVHQYAAGRPDQADRAQLLCYGEQVWDKMNQPSSATALPIPGNRPYKKAGGSSLVPKADERCIGCGLCAGSCPAQAIDKGNLKTTDSGRCIACMRCVVRCPQSARKVNSALVAIAAQAIKKACAIRKEPELFI